MAFKDLREFIDKLEKTGDLVRIKEEVDWNLEFGAILRKGAEAGAPAPFIEKTKDYDSSYKQMGNVLATFRRLAIAMEMSPDSTYTQILDAYDERRETLIKPVLVKDGPCKENIHLGNDVDLWEFPVPMVHEGDGGRFIATWHVVCTKDPDSQWVNWGMYRQMMVSKNQVAAVAVRGQHIGRIFYEKYEARGKPMEFAVAIGPEPITTFVGACGIPYGVSEVDVIGGVRGEPLAVVKCETVDLMVPATSEIVYEGICSPTIKVDEGPFGEYLGYAASPKGVKQPLCEITAVTHRNNPILTSSCMGVGVDDSHVAMNISFASDIRSALRQAGLPITGIYLPPEACCGLCVIGTKVPFSNIATEIAHCVWANKNGRWMYKIMVVDDDIDPTNMNEVIHAFTTKYHPGRGTTILPNSTGAQLVPFSSTFERTNDIAAKVLFDCTWPRYWPKEDIPRKSAFKTIYPSSVQEKALKKWINVGLKDK